MGILDKLLGRDKPPPSAPSEQAVLVAFRYGSTDLTALFALEAELDRAITGARVGEYDGNEVAADGSDGSLYIYGPDADRLFAVVQPLLAASPFMRGATATLRYGSAGSGARQHTVQL